MTDKSPSYDVGREDLNRKLSEWIDSGEAAIAMRKAAEETDKAIARMNQARRLTWEQLNTPIGPFSRNC